MKYKSRIIHNRNFLTLYLLGGFIIFSILFLWFTQQLIGKIKENETRYIKLFCESASLAPIISDNKLNTFFENIKEGITFPVIISSVDDSSILSHRHIDLPEDPVKADKILKKKMREMDEINDPILIDIGMNEKYNQHLHYGGSELLSRLTLYSFILPIIVFFFILVGVWVYRTIKKYEESSIWVGMAKETAHQLGTPVSSLMAWIEFLYEDFKNDHDKASILAQMSMDIKRLEQISDRFNKIGNIPTLKPINISQIIGDISSYFKNRLPNYSKKIEIDYHCSGNNLQIAGNATLIQWAFENLIKNSIDAIRDKQGKISIQAHQSDKKIIILISDNGIGMSKSQQKKVFIPGYSTKKIGWGLGLTLVKRIIEEYHDGKIIIKDSIPDNGTIFEITLNAF